MVVEGQQNDFVPTNVFLSFFSLLLCSDSLIYQKVLMPFLLKSLSIHNHSLLTSQLEIIYLRLRNFMVCEQKWEGVVSIKLHSKH